MAAVEPNTQAVLPDNGEEYDITIINDNFKKQGEILGKLGAKKNFDYTSAMSTIVTANTTNALLAEVRMYRRGFFGYFYIAFDSKKDIIVPASGDIGNFHVATAYTSFRPITPAALSSMAQGPGTFGFLNDTGTVVMTSVSGQARTIPKNTRFQLTGAVLLA